MKIQFTTLLLVSFTLAGCDRTGDDVKDYAYYSSHLVEAKSVSDQCLINGTSGMNKEQILQCNIAHEAYSNRSYDDGKNR